MNFGFALTHLTMGHKVRRSAWRSRWLALQMKDRDSKMDLPYLYVKTEDDYLVPWMPTHTDILANDWEYVEEPETYTGSK